MGKEFAQLLDVLPAEDIALMRMVQEIFVAVQYHAEACAMDRIKRRTEMMQQRFDLAPVDIGAHRVLKQAAQEMKVFVTHGTLRATR